jgi:pilin isopeptide linkage protein
MKKMKRILSLALASVMVLGLMVPTASAVNIVSGTEEDLSSYKDANGFWLQLPFDKILKVNNKTVSIPDNTSFEFTMTPLTPEDGTKVDKVAVQAGPALGDTNKTTTISFASSDLTNKVAATDGTSTSTITKTGTFTLPTFTTTGIYRYSVKEVVPDANNGKSYITYDSTTYRVDLYVTSKTVDNKEVIGVSSIVAVDVQSEGSKDNIVFENTLSSSGLTIKKEIDGSGKEASRDFVFYMKIPVGGDNLNLQANTQIKGTKHDVNGGESTVTITVNGNRDDYVVVTRNEDGTFTPGTDGACQFTLKGGESITFDDLPVGMIFYVTEGNYSADGYVTTASYTGGTTGDKHENSASFADMTVSGVQAKGTISSGTNTMTFTNKKDINPDTGISVDFIPYVVVMLLAVAGCVLFVCKKRSNAR